MFSPVMSHWAPQPSQGTQTACLCDPVSVWRSIPQHVTNACACERVHVRTRVQDPVTAQITNYQLLWPQGPPSVVEAPPP